MQPKVQKKSYVGCIPVKITEKRACWKANIIAVAYVSRTQIS